MGTIFGALWGGSLFRRLYLLLAVMIGLLVVVEVREFLNLEVIVIFGRRRALLESIRCYSNIIFVLICVRT